MIKVVKTKTWKKLIDELNKAVMLLKGSRNISRALREEVRDIYYENNDLRTRAHWDKEVIGWMQKDRKDD